MKRLGTLLVVLFSACSVFGGGGGGGVGANDEVSEIPCESLSDCPEGSTGCHYQKKTCIGCESDGDCAVGQCGSDGLCHCELTGSPGCPCNSDGSCDSAYGDDYFCLTPDDHWKCEGDDCTCKGDYTWIGGACDVPECNNECSEARRAAFVDGFDDVLETLPNCGTPPDGVFEAANDVDSFTVELKDGDLLTVDEIPCEDMFPGKTPVYFLDTCERMYRCGCCFWGFGPAATATGWGLKYQDGEGELCGRTGGGLYYDIGGPWVPPAQTEEEVPDECTKSWGCCEYCGDQCGICDSLRDIECFKDCYGECHRCCFQCF